MRRSSIPGICHILPTLVLITSAALAQVGVFSAEDLARYSPKWEGERFPDGRPKVSDDLLQRSLIAEAIVIPYRPQR